MKKISGLVPAIIQDENTGTVLMLGYMNEASLKKTLRTKKVWFYSRSKKRLWMKGESSGNVLSFVSMREDCDNDALLVKARPAGPTCHTGAVSCFSEKSDDREFGLSELFSLIEERKKKMPKGSYTAFLFKKGLKKICEKIAEESEEVIRAARKETKKRLVEESVDVLYHLFVLLAFKKISLTDITTEIKKRRG